MHYVDSLSTSTEILSHAGFAVYAAVGVCLENIIHWVYCDDWLIAIEGDYTGPKLDPNGRVTVEFTEQLMATYKEQQKLHRRYAYQVLSFH